MRRRVTWISGEEARRRAPYAGFGLMWAWTALFWGSVSSLADGFSYGIYSSRAWTLSVASTIAVLPLVVLYLGKRSGGWAGRARVGGAGAAATLVGSALLAASGLAGVPGPAAAALPLSSAVLLGAGSGALVMAWADAYRQLPSRTMAALVLASLGVSLACSLVFPGLRSLPAWAAAALLPLASFGCLAACRRLPEPGVPSGSGEKAQETPDVRPGRRPAGRPARGAGKAGEEEARHARARMRRAVSHEARVAAAILAAYAAMAVTDGFAPPSLMGSGLAMEDSLATASGKAAAMVALSLCYARGVQLGVSGTFKAVSPLLVAGAFLFLLASPASVYICKGLFALADGMLYVMLFIYFTDRPRAHPAGSPLRGVALGYGAMSLGALLGNEAGCLASASGQDALPLLGAAVSACVLLISALPAGEGAYGAGIAVRRAAAATSAPAGSRAGGSVASGNPGAAACGPASPRAAALGGAGGAALSPADGSSASAGGARAGSPALGGGVAEPGLDALCAIVADRYDLTARESEVLSYLARGRSQPYICEALCLSASTVASHVKRAYAKLGVHSKQELIDLVEAAAEG